MAKYRNFARYAQECSFLFLTLIAMKVTGISHLSGASTLLPQVILMYELIWSPFHASEALDQEKNTAAVFHRLPFHYLEISRILFLHAKEAFGTELLKVSRPALA